MLITIIYSVPTSYARRTVYSLTDEDTGHSAKLIEKALTHLGYQTRLFPLSETNIDAIKSVKSGCIVNLIEWTGHDLPIAKYAIELIQNTGLPFTGVNATTYVQTTNKILMKQLFSIHDISTPAWQVFYHPKDGIRKPFHYPVILKPAFEHCSVGIQKDSIVKTKRALYEQLYYLMKQFRQPIIAEEYIQGDEYHIPIIETGHTVKTLSATNIRFNNKSKINLLTFNGRWNPGHPEFIASSVGPSRLTKRQTHIISIQCIRAFVLCGLRDYARVDLRIKNNIPYLLEINSNPGLDSDPEYEFMYSCIHDGISFEQLIQMIMTSCLLRFGVMRANRRK